MIRNRPPIFFKYYPVGEWLPGLLSGKALKFSDRGSFNDPFDSRPTLKVDFSDIAYRTRIEQYLINDGWSAQARKLKFKELDKKTEPFELEGPTSHLLDSTGLLCLGSEWTNMLLWSHYANHHRGFCIGFHSNIDVFQVAFPVHYGDNFPIIVRPHDDDDATLRKSFLIKQRCWEYENEWRIIKRKLSVIEQAQEMYRYDKFPQDQVRLLTEHNGPTLYRFDKKAIAEITFGLNISSQDEAFILHEVNASGLNIPVYKISKSIVSYTLTRKQLM